MSRFLIFTDLHSEIIDNPESRIEALIGATQIYKPDFILNLGDFGYFSDTTMTLCPIEKQPVNYRYFNEQQSDEYFNRAKRLLNILTNNVDVPIFHTIGNHDLDFASKDEVIKHLHLPHNYYYEDIDDIRLVVLDTNYYLEDGKEISYLRGNNFATGNSSILPQEQLRWIESVIQTDKQVVFLSHHPLNPDPRGIQNAQAFQEIINGFPDKTFVSFYGHKHVDTLKHINNAIYININSMSYFWQGEDTLLPTLDWSDEVLSDHPILPYIIRYSDPLFVVVDIKDKQLTLKGRANLTTRQMAALDEEKGISDKISDRKVSL